ncbi:MAG: IS1182 family transposase [Chloroflexi bacterium]|nr:IS1182 family transposase [Chloroflexota bacterium]
MPFISYSRDQDWLLPPSLGELIPADHPARFIAEVVDQLPWDEVGISHLPKAEGKPSYPPQVLLAVWLYGFMTRTRSSRKLEQACRENLPMMWLTGLLHPDHSTLSRFYKQNRQAMRPLFKATVQLAVQAGLVEFAFQAVDGTRMGSASRRTLHSRDEITRLLAAVEAELAAMDATEAQSDDEPGPPSSPGPRERWGKEEIHQHLTEALAEMDRRATLPGGRHDAAMASISDPEAAVMKARAGYVVGYNAQAVVDAKAQIVVAADVVSSASDGAQLLPMLAEAKAMTGRQAVVAAADSGYFDIGAIVEAEETGIQVFVPKPRRAQAKGAERYAKANFVYDAQSDTYTCPEGKTLVFTSERPEHHGKPKVTRIYRGRECQGCPALANKLCTSSAAGRTVHRYEHDADLPGYLERLHSERGRELTRWRSGTVEPLFASTKERLGMLRFLLRGLLNAKGEWYLTCAVHNLLKLWRYVWRPQHQPVTSGA